jgi:hypothetical protein
MMPGQTPYTDEEREQLAALVRAAADTDPGERAEPHVVVLDDTGALAHLRKLEASLAAPRSSPALLIAIDEAHARELARSVERFADAVIAVPAQLGRTLAIDALTSFRTIFESPPCVHFAPRGPTFRQRLTRIAILAFYARPVRR